MASRTRNDNTDEMIDVVRYKHEVNSGDLIGAMAGMQHIYKTTGKKAIVAQRLNVPGSYYAGATHPVRDESGTMVTMSAKQWEMLVPLLMSQDYIEGCEVWQGQGVDVDLNKMRSGPYTTMPFGSLNRWLFYCDPALACDLSKPWLNLPRYGGFEDKVALNFTSRYRNYQVSYYFLKPYEKQLLFFGTEGEHADFCEANNLEIEHYKVQNFYELAVTVHSCKFLLANQSMIWNMMEAAKSPRLLEVCREASNCIPIGEWAYDFLHQEPLQFYFDKMMKEL